MSNVRLDGDAVLPAAAPVHRDWPYRRSIARRYGVAVIVALIAAGVRYAMFGFETHRAVFSFFVPAAMVAVWYGGLGPGMLATVLGLLLGDYFFFAPRFAFWPIGMRESMGIGVYAITTPLCVFLCENLHHRIRQFERALDHQRHHIGDLPAMAREFADYLTRYYALATHHSYSYPSWPYRRSLLMRYGVAVGMVIVAFALRYSLFGTQDNRFPFIFFVPAAMIAVWYGGLMPGLLAAVAGLLLGDYFFLSDHEALGTVQERERVSMGLYAVMTTLCVMLFENLQERIRRLEHAFDRARHHRHPHAEAAAPAGSQAAPAAR